MSESGQAVYITLAAAFEHQDCIKGSDFLGYAYPLSTVPEAMDYLQHLRQQHPNASHICWAYRLSGVYRFSDDGEPAGTAGSPMYRALEGQGLDRVLVAVVRYFGGTKLGTGGLARAYSGTVAEMLRLAPRQEIKPKQWLQWVVPFELLNVVYHQLSSVQVLEKQEEYLEQGLQLRVLVFAEAAEGIAAQLFDASRGRLSASYLEVTTPSEQ